MPTRQLTRSRSNRFLAGVAGGIAAYTGTDPTIVRLITAILVCCTAGFGLAAYIVAWIILPEEGSATSGLDQIISTLRRGNNSRSNPNDLR